jgi:hypothetical protein
MEETMSNNVNRRDFLKISAGVAAGTATAGMGGEALAQGKPAAGFAYKPEKGAKLRVLRWKRFVQGDEDTYMERQGVHRQVRHRGAGGQRGLGGRAAQGCGGGQRRQRPGRDPVDQRRSAPVP